MFTSRLLRLSLVGLIGSCSAVFAATPRLKVSDYHQFLVTETGAPFFWLGDTAWELFYRLNREDATRCLENRAKLGFNVVQAVAIAELNGHSDPNPYGFLPLTDLDPAQPAVKDGPNNDCWDHVDFIVGMANELGITDGFLPTWGRYWHDKTKDGKPLFTPANAEVYGEWLGKRYKDAGLVWILGMKTEDKGTKGRTLAGGRSEVLGAHNYNTSGVRDDTPYFEVLDATMSCATYREVCFVGGWWKVPVLAKFWGQGIPPVQGGLEQLGAAEDRAMKERKRSAAACFMKMKAITDHHLFRRLTASAHRCGSAGKSSR